MSALRPYQRRAIEMLRDAFRAGAKRPILQLPTGAGKTHIAMELIRLARARGKRVAFIVDRLELVEQTAAKLREHGIAFGVIQGQHELTDPSQDVQVISIQTLARRKKWPFEIALQDEAHVLHKAHKTLYERWNALPIIGLTATPWSKGLGKMFDALVKPISISELIDQGYLVESDIYAPSSPDMTGVRMQAGDFNQKQTAVAVGKKTLIADIVRTWERLGRGQQTLVMATNIAHSKAIVSRFRGQGYNAHHVDAYTDTQERRELIGQFRRGEVMILSSVGVLTVGFDSPNASCLVLARPTASRILHTQMIGRVLRTCPGKERALILDHAGNFQRNGMHTDPTPDTLDHGEKGEPVERTPKEKLPKPCSKCHAIKPAGQHVCEQCGFAPEKQNTVHEEAGELVRLGSKNDGPSERVKDEWMRMLRYYTDSHGKKPGYAVNLFRAKFGAEPKILWPKKTTPPTQEVLNFITSRKIAFVRVREKEAANG